MWFPTFELLLYAAGDTDGDVLMSKSREVTDNLLTMTMMELLMMMMMMMMIRKLGSSNYSLAL